MNSSDPRTMMDSTGASRAWQQDAPWDHGLHEVLDPRYFDRNYLQIRERDRVEVWASDLSWVVAFVVVAKSLSARTVSALMTVPPMFLLQSADRSGIHVAEQLQKAENAYRAGKMRQGEYEATRKVLESLRDHGSYPSPYLAQKLIELQKALEAERLTREQHQKAKQELLAVVSADRMDEVISLTVEKPVVTLVMQPPAAPAEFTQLKTTDVRPEISRVSAGGVIAGEPLMKNR